ncbi:uncharacterized protein A4U43_C09F1350 [Asparagus officinalis]|uniref:ADF-H domain-containing protein n=1 Tax=Asparagus officinalis TaxID=4686 RepID=A0A5P1E4G0_ASPOF|nr:uncharacterized protein A4U43_C09F1350 [Asparagus officinalis]
MSYEDFTASLREKECRYAIYDFDFVTEENCQKSNIFFIASTDNSSNNNNDKAATQPDGRGGASMSREHLFNKTVTPSDVGKLNRLVIQKQHEERHLPALRDGGRESVLVSFEDTADGKVWRFRYSYWNSSQSSKT